MARRGRPPNKPQPPIEHKQLPEDQLRAVQLATAAAHDEAQRWVIAAESIGVIKTSTAFGNISDQVAIEKYRDLKESKTYIGMPYQGPDGKWKRVSTLEDLGEALGKSRRRFEQILSNQRLLGDLYEQAEALGLRQRDYNAIKLLPADDQAVIKKALEDKADRETVIEQLVTLAERQAREKKDLTADKAALEERQAKLTQRAERAELKAAKASREWKEAPPDERERKLRQHVDAAALRARNLIIAPPGIKGSSLHDEIEAYMELQDERDEDYRAYVGGLVDEIAEKLQIIRDRFLLPGNRLTKD